MTVQGAEKARPLRMEIPCRLEHSPPDPLLPGASGWGDNGVALAYGWCAVDGAPRRCPGANIPQMTVFSCLVKLQEDIRQS
ncbi:hypothetical protein SKAU_G00311690 [Synaphobranchus kaupii]|uniref:Uncharacterized protein n=1 Tax=Synaphobranchus kaupii TaxID=118154 RepID=A0A9Q1ILE9_SYNKA|nr:hypothetical protein SKAU_G00311690 [Synaphobranchus kaupii]